MQRSVNQLHSFLQRIKTISFIQRLLFWKKIRNKLMEAAVALRSIDAQLQILKRAKWNLIAFAKQCEQIIFRNRKQGSGNR